MARPHTSVASLFATQIRVWDATIRGAPRRCKGRRRRSSRILRENRLSADTGQTHEACHTVKTHGRALRTGPRAAAAPPPHRRRAAPAADAFGKRKRSWLREKLSAAGAAIVALVAKLKAVLLLLPKIKILATAGTALVSVAAYSLIWGWEFAAGFVVLIFVHEMGHVIAAAPRGDQGERADVHPLHGRRDRGALARRQRAGRGPGRPRRADPRLVPRPRVALAGLATGTDSSRRSATSGFFLNLFNLMPVVPLDGGRAMAAMAPWMWFLGFGGLVVLDFLEPNPILLIISLFAGYELYRRWEQRRSPTAAQTAYYRVSPRTRALVGAVYVGLIVLLAIGMHATYLHRAIP